MTRLVGHGGSFGPAHFQRLVAPPAEGEAHLHQGGRDHHLDDHDDYDAYDDYDDHDVHDDHDDGQ